MKKTSFTFLTIESLSSFLSVSNGMNVSILPKMKIVNGLFPDEEVEIAIQQFGASIITSAESFSFSQSQRGFL